MKHKQMSPSKQAFQQSITMFVQIVDVNFNIATGMLHLCQTVRRHALNMIIKAAKRGKH